MYTGQGDFIKKLDSLRQWAQDSVHNVLGHTFVTVFSTASEYAPRGARQIFFLFSRPGYKMSRPFNIKVQQIDIIWTEMKIGIYTGVSPHTPAKGCSPFANPRGGGITLLRGLCPLSPGKGILLCNPISVLR